MLFADGTALQRKTCLKKPLKFEDVWPASASKLSADQLRQLNDSEFAKLKRALQHRALKIGYPVAFAKALARQIEIKRRPEPRTRYRRAEFLARFRDSEILDAFVHNRKSRWKQVFQRRKGIEIECTNFSFLDNPQATFDTLVSLAEADCDAFQYRINFNDEHVTDIAPFLIFGVMREKMAQVTTGGTVRGPTRRVLEAVGLRNFLRMRPFSGMGLSDDIWPLPLIQRRKSGSSNPVNLAAEPSSVELRADEIAARVNDWLGAVKPPKELTEIGLGKLKSIITETLNNAERHGRVGGDGEWITAGFMVRKPMSAGGADPMHVCHLTLLNLGRPIADTIAGAPPDVTLQIGKYQRIHRGSGLSPETLATVFALQDGISRLPQGGINPSGGTGLMDMVEFANEVGRCSLPGLEPKVAILSGNTYICFKPPYSEGFGTANSDRRLQWFNDGNSVQKPPDRDFVMDLPRRFPGTMITLRFVLDASLETPEKDDDKD